MRLKLTRRSLLLGGVPALHAQRTPAIRVESVRHSYEDFAYRTPMKWAQTVITSTTILNVDCVVRTSGGASVGGFGSMKMGNTWSYRSEKLTDAQTLEVMKRLAARISKLTGDCRESAHPVELNRVLEPAYFEAAAELAREMKLPEPIPKLCTLVTASAFDAALHDAYGKANRLNCYQTYGPEFLPFDLSRYLDRGFRGEYLNQYVTARPVLRLPLYHLVGGADPLTAEEVKNPVGDGLPETLADWIRREHITHFKLKMRGNDLGWDVDRAIGVHRVAVETHRALGIDTRQYSLDFNEMCRSVDYLVEFLTRVREKETAAFEAIQYIEQPTKRNLQEDRANVMHKAVKLKPVVIDESLTDYEALMLAREMGYSGIALKACKGQSQSLLMAAAAQKFKMFCCVQDLTCPGASLIHSAGLAAHVPGVPALEANARQFCPAANQAWVKRFPGIFIIRDGTVDTSGLTRPGLSAVA